MSLESRLSPPREQRQVDASLAIVNVVLLLIFFFLATGALMNAPDYRVQLPNSKDVPLSLLPKPILVIEGDGTMRLNGEPVEPGTLNARIGAEPILHILANRDDPADVFLSQLDAEELFAVELKLVTIHVDEE